MKIHFPADMRLPTNESDDPLTRALAPPPNETQEERAVRVKKEIEAQRVSDAIDEAIRPIVSYLAANLHDSTSSTPLTLTITLISRSERRQRQRVSPLNDVPD